MDIDEKSASKINQHTSSDSTTNYDSSSNDSSSEGNVTINCMDAEESITGLNIPLEDSEEDIITPQCYINLPYLVADSDNDSNGEVIYDLVTDSEGKSNEENHLSPISLSVEANDGIETIDESSVCESDETDDDSVDPYINIIIMKFLVALRALT